MDLSSFCCCSAWQSVGREGKDHLDQLFHQKEKKEYRIQIGERTFLGNGVERIENWSSEHKREDGFLLLMKNSPCLPLHVLSCGEEEENEEWLHERRLEEEQEKGTMETFLSRERKTALT